MAVGRGFVAAAFVGGKLYIANGFVGYAQASSLVIYDPATGEISYGKSNPLNTQGASVGVALDGKFYVVGGCASSDCLAPVPAVQIYDPASNSWSSAPDYPHPVAALACGAIAGKLYCAGGHGANYLEYADGYVYDPADPDAGWSPIADLPGAGGGLWGMAYAVGEGKLLISGGVTADNTVVTNAGYAYDPASDRWGRLPNANHAVYRGGSACGFYRFGGFDVGDNQVNSAEVLPGYTPCGGARPIPYLTAAPASGTLKAGASQKITLTWDGTGQKPFTRSDGYLKVSGATPYAQPIVALETHWVAQPISLALDGSADPDPVRVGQGLAYTLTVTNAAADDHGAATQTKLSVALSEGLDYVGASGDASCSGPSSGSSAAPSAASGAPGTISCDLGTIAQGASKTVTIAVKAERAGTFKSHFEVGSRETDDSGKNALDLTTTVLGKADISLSLWDASVKKGKSGAVPVTVANAGPDTATDVKLKLSAGAELELSGQGSCQPSGDTVTCDLGDLESGAKSEIKLTAKGLKKGAASIQGQVSTSADDPNPDNNVASATVTVKSNGGGGGGGAFGWFALLGLIALVLGSLYIRQRGRRPIVAVASLGSGVREGMSRHATTLVLSLFALMLVVGASFAPSAYASGASAQRHSEGLTERGVQNATASARPSRFVRMSAQASTDLLKQAKVIGPHALDSKIPLTISLKPRNAAKLQSFLQQVQNPASPLFRQFLTPAQFANRFGPSKNDVAQVLEYLKRHGISVKSVSSNRLLIRTEATTETYNKALRIRIKDYRLNGRSFYSTSSRPQLPRALAGVVRNVIGLDRGVRLQAHSRSAPIPARLAPRAGVTAPPANLTYLSPLQIAKAYDWPSVTDADNAAGVTIAILTYSSSGLGSLDAPHDFWAAYGLPDHTLNVIPVDGDSGDTSGMGETLLDVELSGAMAPGAKLDVYLGGDASLLTTIDAMNKAVTDNKAAVMTTSWGLPEAGWGALAKTANDVLREAAAQGISVFAAAGDNGASDCSISYCPPGNSNADFPSSSPYVTAANGTELTIADTSGTYGGEQAWNSTGGAVSQLFDQPDWQKGPGVPDTGWRMNSDLSLNGGPLHPYAIFRDGGWYGIAGTSAVAPALAGLYAIGVSQQTNGARLGQSNSLLYNDVNADPGNYASDFHDVVSGCNGQLPDGSQSCAGANWDHPTGWGSPRASNLLANLGIHGPAGTLKGTVTDAASGAPIAGATISVEPGNIHLVSADDGSYSRLLAVGDYTLGVTSFGYADGTASVSISDGQDTTQDFALPARDVATLSGKVLDGSGHGYGLYAMVTVTTPKFGQVASLWTDPATGKYRVDLPEGYDYTVAVSPAIDGYDDASAHLSLSADATHNFALTALASCTAPGYKFVTGGFGEDFNGNWPPAGWTVINAVSDSSVLWNTNDHFGFGGWGNWTGGTGKSAAANGQAGSGANGYDTSLVTPPIPVSSLPAGNVVVGYKADYMAGNQPGGAFSLEISSDGGATWQPVLKWTKTHGGEYFTKGVDVEASISEYLPASGSIQLRWRYYNLTPGAFDNYVQIDDVAIGACQPSPGGLVMGQVTDANTGKGIVGALVRDDNNAGSETIVNAADPNLPVGYYLFFSQTGARTLSASQGHYAPATRKVKVADGGAVVQDFALDTGKLGVDPGALDVHVTANDSKTVTFKIANRGSAASGYKVFPINSPPPITHAGAANVPAMSVPIKHPRYITSSLAWIRDHVNGSNGVAAEKPRASASAAWADIADYPAGIGDSTAARSPLTGKVYSMGGVTSGGMLAATLVYDPATNLWTQVASAPVPREAPVSAFVNGKFYVFDGWGQDGNPVAETDIYDPVSDSWSLGAPNPVPAGGGSAIGVVNGKVYIVGGCVNDVCPAGLKATQVYDPISDSWSSAADYPSRILFPACGGINGKLYCAGGVKDPKDGQGGVKAGYVYDPATNEWSPVADIPLPGGLGASFYAAANGKLLMSAGVSGVELTNQGVAYDPTSDSWSALPNASEPIMRGAGACGFYAIGGITSLFGGAQVTAKATVLPGYDRCGTPPPIAWLTIAPPSGSALVPNASKTVALTIDGSGQTPFTTAKTYLEVVGNTPYAPVVVPLTVTWDAQPVSLTLTGSASPESVNKGADITYSLTVENAKADGDGAASETTLTYALPKGVSYVAASGDAHCTAPSAGSSAASAAPGTLTCDFGTIAQGASKHVTIAVKAEQAGTLKSHFEVASRESNNSDKDTLDLKTTVIGNADVGLSLSSASLKKGKSGMVPVTVSNTGPDTATDVKLKLSAGANLKLSGTSGSQGSCKSSGDTVTCDLGDLASGAKAEIKLAVNGLKTGTTSVQGQVTTSADDPSPENDVASATVTVKSNGGGGGAFGWLALAAMIGLALTGAALRRRGG
jgi:N-acetylneuraminic acid mutarotase